MTAVAFSPDGTLLASASKDRTIRLWNLTDGTQQQMFHDQFVVATTDVAFSPDGKSFATASLQYDQEAKRPQGKVLLWNLERGEVNREVTGTGRVSLSPNGSLIAFRSSETVDDLLQPLIRVQDLTAREESDAEVLKIPCTIAQLAPPVFSPDGRSIVVAVSEKDGRTQEALEIWNLATRKVQQRLSVDFHVHALAFSPDAIRLACGGRDGFSEAVSTTFKTVTLNLITGERDRIFPWYSRTVVNLAYDPDGKSLATATAEQVSVWDITPPADPTQQIYNSIGQRNVGPRDWTEWGGSTFRINTPYGKNIPIDWEVGKIGQRGSLQINRERGQVPEESRNIKWAVPLGSQTYGNPVVANGRIFVGTNNGAGYLSYYPSSFDLGVLLCFEEETGKFLWQHSNEKLPTGRVHDWPMQGVCSTPVVGGDRLWYVTNRGEVVCLDTEGFYDGEDDGIPRKDVGDDWVRCFDLPTHMHNDMTRLRAELARAGVKLAAGRRLRKTSDGWTIGWGHYQNGKHEWFPQFAVRRTGEFLPVFRLNAEGKANLSKQVLSVRDELMPGLKSGRIDPVLRAEFERAGVTLAEDEELTAGKKKTTWTVTGTMFGTPRAFRLHIEKDRLHCTRQLTKHDTDEADVVWKLDMMSELGVSQHNMANCSMIAVDGKLFVCTSNGLDESHINLPAPDAPSFMAVDQNTGKVLWTDNSPGKNILHAQWASPSYGVFDGQPQVLFPGGDGWVYSFDPNGDGKGGSRLIWKFDANPKESKWVLGGRGTRNNIIAFPAIYDGLVYIVVGQDPEHGEGDGRLWCIDPAKRMDGSDVSAELAVDADGTIIPHRRQQAVDTDAGEKAVPNPNSAVVWCYTSEDRNGDGDIDFEEQFHRSLSIPVIKDDILYISDFSGVFHCLNAKTGKPYWTYDPLAACWGSALLVDGHVYIADEDGDVSVFSYSADPHVAMKDWKPHQGHAVFGMGDPINTVPNMGSSVYMTPIVANNVLYIVSRNTLFAIEYPEEE